MANEARIYAEGAAGCIVRQVTVANATGISKGVLLMYGSATRTGVAHLPLATARPLGYTVEQKEASDGKTTIGVQRTGVALLYADGAITTGDIVLASTTTANRVERLTGGNFSTYEMLVRKVGRALETIADGAQGKIALDLG